MDKTNTHNGFNTISYFIGNKTSSKWNLIFLKFSNWVTRQGNDKT